jgi:hypothetical protein
MKVRTAFPGSQEPPGDDHSADRHAPERGEQQWVPNSE